MTKPQAYWEVLKSSEVLGLETLLALLFSALVTWIFFYLIRCVPMVTRLILPGYPLTEDAIEKAEATLANMKARSPDTYPGNIEIQFLGQVLIGTAIRGAASIISIVLIFSIVLSVTAPLIMLD